MSQGSTEMEWQWRTGPFTVLLNPGVFSPTHTSRTLADALEIGPGDTVVDVGCGSGVLSFVAARLGAERVIGCDISSAAVVAAGTNADRLGLSDRVEFRTGSLLEPVRDVRADVLIGDVSGIPDEIAQVTGWFPDGRAGGPTGVELPLQMIEQIGDTLVPGGRLYLLPIDHHHAGELAVGDPQVPAGPLHPFLHRRQHAVQAEHHLWSSALQQIALERHHRLGERQAERLGGNEELGQPLEGVGRRLLAELRIQHLHPGRELLGDRQAHRRLVQQPRGDVGGVRRLVQRAVSGERDRADDERDRGHQRQHAGQDAPDPASPQPHGRHAMAEPGANVGTRRRAIATSPPASVRLTP